MDGFAEIAVFARVVDQHSFTRAARTLGITSSGVSRAITRLERRLGVRLLLRTTRSLSLTDEGAAYYARCKKILSELDDAASMVASTTQAPVGRLRVDTSTTLGQFVLGPALPQFLQRYPQLALDLTVRDHVIDPIAEGIDVTLRIAELRDSELVSKLVGTLQLVVVGAPRYFAKHGRPKHPDDLANHHRIGFLASGSVLPWRFKHERSMPFTGRLNSNNSSIHREVALAGLGLVQMFEFHVAEEIARGRLEVVLADHQAPPRSVYALYERQRAALPKVRAFLEWAEELIRVRSPARRRS